MKIYGDETDDFDSHINIESLQYIIADMQRDLLSRDNQITILTTKLTEQEAELVKLRKVAEAAAAIRDLEHSIATLEAACEASARWYKFHKRGFPIATPQAEELMVHYLRAAGYLKEEG